MEKKVSSLGLMKKMIVPVLLLISGLSVGSSAYLYNQVQILKQDPQKVAEEEVNALIAKVGELMVLPADETPTVATVADPEQLKTQAFFANAQTGDKVLLYTTAKKAILYNPATHKIVEVAPINIGNQPAAAPEVAGETDEVAPPVTP